MSMARLLDIRSLRVRQSQIGDLASHVTIDAMRNAHTG